jgi:type II secretory pathway pseudopilin PulG
MTTTLPHTPPTLPGHPTVRRGGFSFVEILFAVIILGLGFIMLAAIFPVGIAQQQLTIDNSVAMALSRSGGNTIQTLAVQTTAPNPAELDVVGITPTHPVNPLMADQWGVYSGSMISASDPRYAWSFVYRRATASTEATVYIFTIRARNVEAFGVPSITRVTSAGSDYYPADIEPQPVQITLIYDTMGGKADVADVGGATTPMDPAPNARRAAAEGAFIVMASSAGAGLGKSYQLGILDSEDADSITYSLTPGHGMASAAENGTYDAFLMGRGYKNPADPTEGFEGGNRAISCELRTITALP